MFQILSGDADFVDFLFQIADIGAKRNQFSLRNKCLLLIQQLPINKKQQQFVESLCKNFEQNEPTLEKIERESPTKLIHLLGITYALLLPTKKLQTPEAEVFRVSFVKSRFSSKIAGYIKKPDKLIEREDESFTM